MSKRIEAAIEWMRRMNLDVMDLAMAGLISSFSLFVALATVALVVAIASDPQCSKCRCESHAIPAERVEAVAK